MNSVVSIVELVMRRQDARSTTLVGVDGLGGAGKTSLATSVATELSSGGRRVDVVHFDDFYLPSSLRTREAGVEKPIGGDFDWQRLRDDVLIPLREGRSARYSSYDWNANVLAGMREVPPGGVVLVEGVGSTRNELAALYDVRIWVECPRAVRLSRGLARDGAASRARWERDWMPAEDRYRSEHRPDLSADIVVSGEAG
jgi:uridine kinase